MQLQKSEDAAPEIVEFDHVKDHLEPFLRRGQAHAPQATTSAATSTTSASLSSSTFLKDMPGLGQRYGSLFGLSSRARAGEGHGTRDELDQYEALFPAGGPGASAKGKEKGKEVGLDAEHVKAMREMREMEDVASLDKRWTSSWKQPLLAK